MEAEQSHIDRVHARVEELRAAAERERARVEAGRGGSTFQAVYERDVAAHHHARRAQRYTFGDLEALVFGRLDLGDPETLHLGRVSVADEDRDLLLVDWRAPAAAAFYQATAAAPQGVARRRTLTCDGPRLVDLDDEILDVEAADRLGLDAVTGRGALLAALTRTRTGRMRDIVATIQADQDRIIRLPATGTVIVSGGPGTGKTVVALHRVAYLLYRNRERFDRRGVLVVGPTDAFTRYVGNVLPALGEDRAVLRSLPGFAAGRLELDGWDDPDVAAVKGSAQMAALCRRAVRAAFPPLPRELRVRFEGTTAAIDGRELERLRDRAWRRLRPPDPDGVGGVRAAGAPLRERLLELLWRRWLHTARGTGERVDERRPAGFEDVVLDQPEVVRVLADLWPDLGAEEVLTALAEGRIGLDAVAGDDLAADAVERLGEVWGGRRGVRFTVDDVALLDEIDHVLGAAPEQAPTAGDEAGVADATPDVDAGGYRDFAHVVVDEAQDLSPMQWRMIARRGAFASWTVVGDLAQRSRTSAPETWDEVADLVGRRQRVIEHLTINYRTPAEVMELARAVLLAGGDDAAGVPDAVRATGQRPRLVRADDPVAVAVAEAVAAAARREGVVAAVVAEPDLPRAQAELARLADGAASEAADALGRVQVFAPRTVKGLEFDAVVVASPDRIASGPVGHHDLYVAVTRTTGELVLVAHPDAEVPGAGIPRAPTGTL